MGMSLTTLQVYGVDKEELKKKLAPGDLLREQNAPWLGVVPEEGEEPGAEIEDVQRFTRLAARLTKGNGAAALVFFWFDDESFRCAIYRDGRKRAECRSGESWAKLGRQLDALYGDEASGKALRYASRCVDLEEELRLVEETFGAALYDHPLEEPRRVPRGDTTLRAVKEREATLRKRPKQYLLTELPRGDWPEELQTRETLLELLRPEWRKYDLSSLLYYAYGKPCPVPGAPELRAYSFMDFTSHRDGLLLYNVKTGEYRELNAPQGASPGAVWRTRQGNPVLISRQVTQEHESKAGWFRDTGFGAVSCVGPDGAEKWRFAPEMRKDDSLVHVHTSPGGVVTLIVPGHDGSSKTDTRLWQIDGETGEVLRSRTVPIGMGLHKLVYAEALDLFVYACRQTKELVILNTELEEVRRFGDYRGSGYFEKQLCGQLLWEQSPLDKRAMCFYDLRDGSAGELRLEIPAYVLSVLRDGRILGVNEKQNVLTVFDREGTVVSRCSVPGELRHVCEEDGRVCLAELRGPDFGPLVCDELFDETKTHVWRLDPAFPSAAASGAK